MKIFRFKIIESRETELIVKTDDKDYAKFVLERVGVEYRPEKVSEVIQMSLDNNCVWLDVAATAEEEIENTDNIDVDLEIQ